MWFLYHSLKLFAAAPIYVVGGLNVDLFFTAALYIMPLFRQFPFMGQFCRPPRQLQFCAAVAADAACGSIVDFSSFLFCPDIIASRLGRQLYETFIKVFS